MRGETLHQAHLLFLLAHADAPSCHHPTLQAGYLRAQLRWRNSALVSRFLCRPQREGELHNPKTPSHVVSDQPNVVVSHGQMLPPCYSKVCFGHVLFCFTLLRNTMSKLSEIHRAVELQVLQVCGTQGIKSPKLCWIDWLFSSSSLSIKCL